MRGDVAISVRNVSKSFKLPHEQHQSIKSALINLRRSKRGFEQQNVLRDVSFEIRKGEFFGIVGRNGSGKSTLLKLLAGIYTPNEGSIDISGKLTPFIELGVGFNPELTGRENVFLNGALLGFNRPEMEAMYDDIVAFAELERFMDQKLKNYSSGMQVRLAFSIAIRAQSDILVLDEVLAVGDAIFQKKCFDYFKQLKKDGRTVVFVSHDTGALQEYCDNSILLEGGEIVRKGKIDDVIRDYLEILNQVEGKSDRQADEAKKDEKRKRWGNGKAQVEQIQVQNERQERQKIFKEDEAVRIVVDFVAKADLPSPVAGITISDLGGQTIFQSNTLWCNKPLRDLHKGERVSIEWLVPNAFNTATFTIAPAISDKAGAEILDWVEDMAQFKVRKAQKSHGTINMQHIMKATYGKDQG